MLKKIFKQKNKKTVMLLAAALAAGVLLMMAEGFFYGGDRSIEEEPPNFSLMPSLAPSSSDSPSSNEARVAVSPEASIGTCYAQALEARLEEALSLVAGAGEVRVLINLSSGRELVVAVDRNASSSVTQEQDGEGGTRYQNSQSSQDSTLIITDRAGVDRPLVLKELEPVVAGVIIIAQGGGDILVRDALTRAASTLLGIDLNRVHVMQMRKAS